METTGPGLLRIMLVDDHPIVRSGLRLLVESEPEMRVVGEAGTFAEALAVVVSSQPDVVLLDLDLGGEDGLDLLPELKTAAPRARVLVLTAITDPETHSRVVRLGALGLVMKGAPADVLLKAIRKVHEGEAWFDRALLGRALFETAPPPDAAPADSDAGRIASLTKRELEVINLVGKGLRNRVIAEQLFITEATVRHHMGSLYEKLGVADRPELIVFAYRHNLVGPSE